jgi:predicted GNAT family N-acyltransferase
MSKTYWKPARSLSDLDQAQRLRFHCLSNELGIRVAHDSHVERDVSNTDCLSSTAHVLVYDEEVCVATARVAFPNPDIARASGTRLGLELEDAGVDLEALADISPQIAEISRLCVLRRAHGTAAAARLYEGLYVLSRQRGARYWVGGVDCRTSILKEAELMRSVLALRGRLSTRYRLLAAPDGRRDSRRRSLGPTSRFYTPEQLELSELGDPESLPIAAALTAFTKRLGATCIGRPALHPTFPRYILPMLVDLEQLPRATLQMFDHGQLAPLAAAGRSAAGDRRDDSRIAS